MKIITIIEDDKITGVKYGVTEVPDPTPMDRYSRAYQQVQKVQKTYEKRIRENKQKNK